MYRSLLHVFVVGGLAVSSFSAFAADDLDTYTDRRIMGFGEAYLGGLRVVPYFDNAETKNNLIAGGAARVNIPVPSNFNLQIDGLVDTIFDGERFGGAPGLDAFDYNVTNFGGAGHFYWRNPERFAFGIMGSWTRYNYEDIGSFDPVEGYTGETRYHDLKTGGFDAQIYLDRWTLYGQAYLGERTRRYFNPNTGEDSLDYQFWGLRGVVRYYQTDNLRFDAEVGYGQEDLSAFEEIADYTVNTWQFAAQATYRFEESPISVFGRYQFESRDQEGEDIFGAPLPDFHRFLVGIRYSFGSGSLLDEERNGPAMDTLQRTSVLRR
ncbi:MAG: hypothetical protein JNK47_02520 [Mesorhizobium sp.]|nr:hypothetical protein [Mesorhizobium sp.]MBL8576075.1 hypothetical protein [Mesorhizobium sp.]